MMLWLFLLFVSPIPSYVNCLGHENNCTIPRIKWAAVRNQLFQPSIEEDSSKHVCVNAVDYSSLDVNTCKNNESNWKNMDWFRLELKDNSISKSFLWSKESNLKAVKACRPLERDTLVKACFHPLSLQFWGKHNWQDGVLETTSEDTDGVFKQHSDVKRISFRDVILFSPEHCYIRNTLALEKTYVSAFKQIQFTINANYTAVVGKRKKLFENSLTKQIAEQLNIHQTQIAGLKVSPGSVKVSFQLLNGSQGFDHSFIFSPNKSYSELPIEEIENIEKQFYEKIEAGNLSIMDMQNQTLLNLSTSLFTRSTVPEEMNAVMGTIIGGFLVVGMLSFIVVSFCKYRKEKQDSVRPIKNSYSVEGVTEIDGFDTFHNITMRSSMRSDEHSDEIECSDALSIHLKPSPGIDSDASPCNISRKTVYTVPTTDMSKPLQDVDSVSSTDFAVDKGTEYTISSFPNMIVN